MRTICEFEQCTGCHACMNVCPVNCIDMKENEYGFLYPKILIDKCTDCGLCKKICPVENPVVLSESTHVYAAINKQKVDYETATSGGIATLFSRRILSENGSVYGVAINEELDIRHICVECAEDIERIKGSKYVQSRIGNIFLRVREDLRSGKKVLFIGTPCQIAGLKKFLRKDYVNLYTCDIVCHGVPSKKMLMNHIESLGYKNRKNRIVFRDKEGFYLTVLDSEGKVLYRKKNFYDIYYIGFLKGLLYRKSCFLCQFAKPQRVGDITLGDFWGFDSSKGEFPVTTTNGLSLIMVNTQKGKSLFEECSDGLIFIERTLEEAVNGNRQLKCPSKRHKNHEFFEKQYTKLGFEKAAKSALWKERIVYAIIDRIGK